jgi:hypothetical protein
MIAVAKLTGMLFILTCLVWTLGASISGRRERVPSLILVGDFIGLMVVIGYWAWKVFSGGA